jgi:EamA domain-containing membrane protein RarD
VKVQVRMTAHKAGVAVAGVIAQIIALGLVPDKYEPWVAVVVALLTAFGVYQVPNKVLDPAPAPNPLP